MVRNNRLTEDEEWMIVRSCVYCYDDDYKHHVREGRCCVRALVVVVRGWVKLLAGEEWK
jgi:hypothetical protein